MISGSMFNTDWATKNHDIAQAFFTALLRGVRGAPPADRPALAQTLVNLARLPDRLGDRLETVDVNPLLVRPSGEGALALDALVVLRGP